MLVVPYTMVVFDGICVVVHTFIIDRFISIRNDSAFYIFDIFNYGKSKLIFDQSSVFLKLVVPF